MKAELRLTVISSKALKCLECQLAFFEQSKRCQSTRRSLTAVDLEGLFRPLSRRSVHTLPQTHLDFISKSGCRFGGRRSLWRAEFRAVASDRDRSADHAPSESPFHGSRRQLNRHRSVSRSGWP